MDWWTWVASVPEPRVLVLQDVDDKPGFGALVGEIHASIARALKCVGCVTNGAVRDLEAVEALGFPLFSGSVSVSHAYAHIVDFGNPVEIGGLTIGPGNLIHGDRNGVHHIPREVAEDASDMARQIREQESELTRFCGSEKFSLAELSARIRAVSKNSVPSVSPHTNE
jgi:regulator of RNase E activity RraA